MLTPLSDDMVGACAARGRRSATPGVKLAQSEATSSVTLRDYLHVVWLRKWLVLLVVVACTGTAFLVSYNQTRMYSTLEDSIASGEGSRFASGMGLARKGLLHRAASNPHVQRRDRVEASATTTGD
jgi:hypothetical protein